MKKPTVTDHGIPVSFYFKVSFQGGMGIGGVSFKEVSGLTSEREVESFTEGGVNNYEIKLPKQIKHGNLILKRAIMPVENNLGIWIKNTLEGDFSEPIKPQNINIHLLNEEKEPMYQWICTRAYPIKWEIEGFDSEKNAVAIESIEMVYETLLREQ